MHLNRDQAMAINEVRNAGFNPVQAIVLTGRHRTLRCGVVSVLATRGSDRFNIRVSVNHKRNESEILEVESLKTIVDKKKSSDVTTIEGCVVKAIHRTLVTN